MAEATGRNERNEETIGDSTPLAPKSQLSPKEGGKPPKLSGENPGNFFIGPDFKLGEGTDGAKFQTTGVVAGNPIGAGYVVEAISDMGEKVVLVKQADGNGKPVYTAIYPPKSAAKAEEHYHLGKKAEEKLELDSKKWEETLDKYRSSKLRENKTVRVMDVPLIMQQLDFKNYSENNYPEIKRTDNLRTGELRTSYAVLSKLDRGKHLRGISLDLAKQRPKKLAEPVMFLHSSPDSSNPLGLVAVLQLQDQNGAPVIVTFGVEPQIDNNGNVTYALTSVYGRTGAPNNDTPNPKWMQDQINHGRLLYYDETQIPEWEKQNKFELDLPVVKSKAPARGGLGIIPKSLIRGQGLYSHNVLTRADFVNAQNENPNSYQLGRATGTSLPPVDVAAIRARVKGAEVTELGGGRVRVAFPNGHTWLVDTRAGEIKPDAESVKRDYGRDVEPEDVVLGRTRIIGGQTFIDIVGGMTDASTFSHEAFEAAWDLLTKEELHGSLTIGGLTLMQALEREVSKTSYQKLPEGEERMKELNAIIGKYRIKARNRLKREFPELVPKLMWQYTSPQSETDI